MARGLFSSRRLSAECGALVPLNGGMGQLPVATMQGMPVCSIRLTSKVLIEAKAVCFSPVKSGEDLRLKKKKKKQITRGCLMTQV